LGKNKLLSALKIGIFILFGIIYPHSVKAADSTIYFNDASSDSIILGNTAYWEAAFRKNNGSIIYILDKQTGNVISAGNRDESIWKAELANSSGFINSNQWNSERFSYTWSETDKTLTFSYKSGITAQMGVGVDVIITASAENWMNMKMNLQVNNAADAIGYVHFPSELMFLNTDVIEALYPSMPGLLFKKSYFVQKISYEATYPGYPGMFADFFWISTSGGTLALYSINNVDPLIPLYLGLGFSKVNRNDYAYLIHKFGAWKWNGQTFNSPSVRIRIGETKNVAAVSYRTDNGLDKYDSLRGKLADLYNIVAASLEVKLDATIINLSFDKYADIIFPKIPAPSILHFAGIQPGGFDENTPDILPPNPKYGTTETYKNMVSEAQSLGFLAMPYTNPTWWDNESTTVRNLPSPFSIRDIAVITQYGKPLFETYNKRGGYTVCPSAPYVIERIKNSHIQMKNDALSDLIFEDQIGARSWWFDFNKSSPSSISYIDGWLAHARKYKDNLLATEQGFDRLAETEIGFYGSVQFLEKVGTAQQYWGTETWEPFPLAQMMMRDKVFFYQHDLSDETMTFSKENFIWNVSFGYQLNYAVNNTSQDNLDWLKMISEFQKNVFAEYADELVTDFVYLDTDFSKTVFQNYTIYTNWSNQIPRSAGKHVLSAQGFAVLADDGTLNAGIFAGYNGIALTNGDHFIIEKRENGIITLKQPLGNDTQISLEFLSGWKTADRINVFTYLSSKKSFIKVPSVIDNNLITFNLVGKIFQEPVDIFLIVNYH
jgi:hypothetical protein